MDPALTEWERSREREEFVRASILYRPSSSSLSSRFTRAKDQEDEDSVEVNRDEEVGAHCLFDDLNVLSAAVVFHSVVYYIRSYLFRIDFEVFCLRLKPTEPVFIEIMFN